MELRVWGYHGTSASAAAGILRDGFRSSANEYDWLGDGTYFFQDAPHRAHKWATKLFPTSPAVIKCEITLAGCMDFLDIKWHRALADAHDGFLRLIKDTGLVPPKQSAGAHRLDRHVINYLVGLLAEQGHPIKTVRGAFAEGAPVYPSPLYLT